MHAWNGFSVEQVRCTGAGMRAGMLTYRQTTMGGQAKLDHR